MRRSPVDLSGYTLAELAHNADPESLKADTLSALRTGKGGYRDFARDFKRTGRVDQTGQAEQGIQIELVRGRKAPYLADGRHRLLIGRELGLPAVYGQVYRGRRAPMKKPIYEGMIPIGSTPEEETALEPGDSKLTAPLAIGIGLAALYFTSNRRSA